MSEIVDRTEESSARRAAAIRESLAMTDALVERYIAMSEIACDVFGAHAGLRRIQRILLEAENRIDEVVNS